MEEVHLQEAARNSKEDKIFWGCIVRYGQI
jgi:hypothetical protein